MKISLPKITPQIYEDHKCFIDSDMDWTQECVDFACLIAGDIYNRLEAAEGKLKAIEKEAKLILNHGDCDCSACCPN